jgi:hypothetical protein
VSERWDEFIRRAFDPVEQAERTLQLAEHEATRTDPWRWYCRLCGAEGQADNYPERDREAFAHVDACPHGRFADVRTAEHGRLLHVWSYGRPDDK